MAHVQLPAGVACWVPSQVVPPGLLLPCLRPPAQGHGRSAVTAAAILMAQGGAATADEALVKVVKVSECGTQRRQV